ncbi:MAG TPA: amidohydrolase family protein [Acidobacteriaceae bacterium]|jgi:predicted TIM-barrel fold metal-dependent hydrolase|nr:amidohydrolase family protein [Acidobacteriaceae bacterium]
MTKQEAGETDILVSDVPRRIWPARRPPPAGSTDCHAHIFGAHDRYPLNPGRGYTPSPEANLAAYTAMANTLGLERLVIVNPTPYLTDHRCTLAALAELGRHRARGVAVVDSQFTPAMVRELADGGFCAARLNAVNQNSVSLDQLDAVVRLVEPLGWHLELYIHGDQLPDLAQTLLSLPMTCVIDHMGRIPPSHGLQHPAFQTLLRLLDTGKFWVKLCGYRNSEEAAPYRDLLDQARTLIARAPERCVWGTDWPHARMDPSLVPDTGSLLDLLYDWAPEKRQLQRILVENPARVYRFSVPASGDGQG